MCLSVYMSGNLEKPGDTVTQLGKGGGGWGFFALSGATHIKIATCFN